MKCTHSRDKQYKKKCAVCGKRIGYLEFDTYTDPKGKEVIFHTKCYKDLLK